ncbi:thioredoxin superfamily protein [Trifolium repens]|nr:thioredoxin superfamily protein [Trifolium repens]
MLVLGNLIDDYARDGSEHTVSINTINKYALKLLGFAIRVDFSAFIDASRVDNLFELPAIYASYLVLDVTPSVPAVFIGGKYVGSSKDVISLHVDGSLKQLHMDAKAIWFKL